MSPPKITLYSDIETSHQNISNLCLICIKKYEKTIDPNKKSTIVEECKKFKNHSLFKFSNCGKCVTEFESLLPRWRRKCDNAGHSKIKYQLSAGNNMIDYELCSACLKSAILAVLCHCSKKCPNIKICQSNCNHNSDLKTTSLRPVSIGLTGVMNFPDFYVEDKSDQRIFLNKIFFGDDCIEQFYTYLRENEQWLKSLQKPKVTAPAKKTKEDMELFHSQKNCGYCGISFNNTKKNFDHCHFSGRFR